MSTTNACPKCTARVPAGSRFCQSCGATVDGPGAHAQAPPPTQVKKGAGSQMKLFLIGAVAIGLITVAALFLFGGSKSPAGSADVTKNGIPAAGPLPTWLQTADPQIIADYAWAAENRDVLQYMPCYCGCGSVGHDSNATCYYRYDKAGKILGYDAHAMG